MLNSYASIQLDYYTAIKKKNDADSLQAWKYGHKNFQNKSRHVKQ